MKHVSKVAMITGAARGIGAATVTAFAEAGYRVAAVDILADELAALTTSLNKKGAKTFPLVADLADTSALQSLIARVSAQWGRIDILVNNAAARGLGSVRQLIPEDWDRLIATNLTAPAFLTKWVEPHMAAAGGGVVVNITSVEAHIPKGVAAAYAAAKGGLLSLTYDCAAALASSGIRVIAVSPGAVDTAMGGYDPNATGGISELDAEIRVVSEDLIPMRRWAQPDEIASVILWLASDSAGYITGTEITVDGGLTQTWMPGRIKRRMLPGQFGG